MTARGVPPAVYPICGVCCQGEGEPPVLVLARGDIPILGPDWGTPSLPPRKRTWDQRLGYPPPPRRGPGNIDQGRDLGPETMGYPPTPFPRVNKLKTLPSLVLRTLAVTNNGSNIKIEVHYHIKITHLTSG